MVKKNEQTEDISIAILNMFPNKASFLEFKNEFQNKNRNNVNLQDRKRTVKTIIENLFKKGIIPDNSEKELISFIEANQLDLSRHRCHFQINFQDIIDTLLSVDSLNNHIKIMRTYALEFGIWEFRPNTMVTYWMKKPLWKPA